MFRKLFGNSKNQDVDNDQAGGGVSNRNSKKKPKTKRVTASARTPELLTQSHPMYKYAMNEFSQTVAPASSNDDGRRVYYSQRQNNHNGGRFGGTSGDYDDRLEAARSEPGGPSLSYIASRSSSNNNNNNSNNPNYPGMSMSESQDTNSPLRQRALSDVGVGDSGLEGHPQTEYVFSDGTTVTSASKLEQWHQHQLRRENPERRDSQNSSSYMSEPTMPDSTYEEQYGDAYIGGPIRYVYPSGYQSMRPRGGPWKLSIAVCFMFTWLSVFIIGHCSDRVDESMYDQNEIDDDTLVYETRWCGSRLLYMMWVVSMLITGLASAYCSVIGYIKLRDFAVANSRSQPPGMVGKSDYYVQIRDGELPPGGGNLPTAAGLVDADPMFYHKTIYQADGTPQFWGGHIYRPTQAAVAITSR